MHKIFVVGKEPFKKDFKSALASRGYKIKSFGVASFPESAKTKEELLKLADEAMYKVKHHSRNGVYALI